MAELDAQPKPPSASVVTADFETFFAETEPHLRRALVAACGPERGREATAEALAWAWEHWDLLNGVDNRLGYLYRVGQSRTRARRVPQLRARVHHDPPPRDPALAKALDRLPERQRVAVVLVHGLGYSMREVADLQGIKVTTVQNHLERGLARLRQLLEDTK
jgi:DNA-directed RNA polymerase specialized sigma24 family protein